MPVVEHCRCFTDGVNYLVQVNYFLLSTTEFAVLVSPSIGLGHSPSQAIESADRRAAKSECDQQPVVAITPGHFRNSSTDN